MASLFTKAYFLHQVCTISNDTSNGVTTIAYGLQTDHRPQMYLIGRKLNTLKNFIPKVIKCDDVKSSAM